MLALKIHVLRLEATVFIRRDLFAVKTLLMQTGARVALTQNVHETKINDNIADYDKGQHNLCIPANLK